MRAIDFSHKITPKGSLVKKILKNFLPGLYLDPPPLKGAGKSNPYRVKKIFFYFCKKYIFRSNFTREIDSAHSRSMKTLPWPWFREWAGVLKRKSNIFGFLWENRRFLGFSRRGIDCAHSRNMKTLPWLWFKEGIGVLKRKFEDVWFSLQYKTLISLNQGQGSVIKFQKCAQWISPKRSFLKKISGQKNEKIAHIPVFYTPCNFRIQT